MKQLRHDINITPLVDIVLVLLVVFIVLVPAVPRALAATLPHAEGSGSGTVLRLSLPADGQLRLDGQLVDPDAWPALVRLSQGPVSLRVSPGLPLSRVTDVLDQVKGARPEARVAVSLLPEASGPVLP